LWGHVLQMWGYMQPWVHPQNVGLDSTILTFLKCRGGLSYHLTLGCHLFMPHPEVLPYMFIRIFICPPSHNSQLERRNNRREQIINPWPRFFWGHLKWEVENTYLLIHDGQFLGAPHPKFLHIMMWYPQKEDTPQTKVRHQTQNYLSVSIQESF
jgi:hypothetical protein